MRSNKLVVRILVGAGLVVAALAYFIVSRMVCIPAYLKYGIEVDKCPDGEFRQTTWARADSLRRGKSGSVTVGATAHFVQEGSTYERVVQILTEPPTLTLLDPSGKETPLAPGPKGWTEGVSRSAEFTLPEVPDGDYILRAATKSTLGTSQVDVPLPIYAPAQVHVITDRPLYQPGDLIKFRAVVLRARDLHPLAGRPGRWMVRDPNGEVLLEEKAPAGDWGVVAGTFPLDPQAAKGNWTIEWNSGPARDSVSVRVEPFVLPRFHVEANADQPFYRAHDKPVIKGKVLYSSGAPVAGATLDLHWSNSGGWPPPSDWMTKTLPQHAEVDKNGTFTLKLPDVPSDLQGQSTLWVRIGATDAAGDRIEGSASVLLSEDAIQVSSVTELENGLVEGFNNRLFLRTTSASGEVLSKVQVKVQRAWDPTDKGVEAQSDEDGVVSLQIDPGSPVNIVIPPPPYRPTPAPPSVGRTAFSETLKGREPTLAEIRAIDDWQNKLKPCVRYTDTSGEVTVTFRVDASGSVRFVGHENDILSRCAAATLRELRLPSGDDRIFQATWELNSQAMPRLTAEADNQPQYAAVNGAGGGGGDEEFNNIFDGSAHRGTGIGRIGTVKNDDSANDEGVNFDEMLRLRSLDARTCLPADSVNGRLDRLAIWSSVRGSRTLDLAWIPDSDAEGVTKSKAAREAVTSCVMGKLGKLSLPSPALADAMGVIRFDVSASPLEEEERGQPTTMLGYEFTVTATGNGKEIGHTKMRMSPGTVPPLRLRAQPVLAEAGSKIQVEALRGPDYVGDLPKLAYLQAEGEPLKSEIDPESHLANFTLPENAEGWVELTASGGNASARALVYVKPKASLEVELSPDQPRYAPGQQAKLGVMTRIAGKGARAAVGLFGVDESLAQLATLPGPDDMARVRPKVETPTPAFGALDGQALTMGRIRGANAAAATVLKVSGRPVLADLDAPVNASGNGAFDPVATLTDHFYEALAELHNQARQWEAHAPKGEKMHPAGMAKLWQQAIAACHEKKIPVDDAYGRPLRLSLLPGDLLALTDPREVIVDGTRLPEDVENWSAWVYKEKP
jgi:hypothetical protein